MLFVPRIAPKLLTNGAYGAPPFGSGPRPRRRSPTALVCIHITSNNKTPPASATAERNYANRDGSGGPSAHFYAERSGVLVQAIDWREFPAWSNGDVKNPQISVPGIQRVVDAMNNGFNANECYGIEIENCGREPEYLITRAQIESNAYLVALAKLEWPELPIDESTVHGHRYLNTVDKGGCPTRGNLETLLAEVIGLANDYFEVMDLQAKLAEQEAIAESRQERIDSLAALATAQELRLDEQTHEIERLLPFEEREAAWKAYADAQKSDGGAILARDTPA